MNKIKFLAFHFHVILKLNCTELLYLEDLKEKKIQELHYIFNKDHKFKMNSMKPV
jgi:hypothetical protein